MPYPVEPKPPFHLLEINVISAQDLHAVCANMHTYAVAWVHPERKLSTRVDPDGHSNPTWNDKFVFRIDDDFLRSYTSAVMIEIYCLKFFRDAHVGTVRVLLSNLLPSQPIPSPLNSRHIPTRFVALQVRRPSGRPQGILNVGVALLDGSMRSMPLYTQFKTSALGYRDLMGKAIQDNPQNQVVASPQPKPAPHLRRTKSEILSEMGDDQPPLSSIEVPDLPPKPEGSVWSDSEVGPPPSVVAAKIASEELDVGSSVLEGWSVASSTVLPPAKEDVKTKLERWKMELPPIMDHGYGSFRSEETVVPSRHGRRKTDGGGGLFSCFGDSYGCECSFFCGRNPKKIPAVPVQTPAKLHYVSSDPNMRRSFGFD